jgi:hypothetical protein
MFYRATHHKLPAINHVLTPKIPATPLKNTRKMPDFERTTTPEKNHNSRKY